MPIIKNAYFSYTADANGILHRDTLQVWNVAVPDGSGTKTIAIYVQGSLGGLGFTRAATFFGKKHLLTFGGGKAATNKTGTAENKMLRIAAKRKKDKLLDGLTNAQKKGKQPLPAGSLALKYSTTPSPADTFINCDKLTADDLKKAFATALLAGADGDAHVQLPGDAVLSVPGGAAAATPLGGATDTVSVHLGYDKSSVENRYAIIHCGDAVKV